MSCERIEELISLSVSGELTQEERAELRGHLAGCEVCRATMAREQRLWAALQQARPAGSEPEGLADRLAAAARCAPDSPPAPRRRRWPLWAAGAAAALLLLAVLAARRKPGEPPVKVAAVVSGRLLVHDGSAWREEREVWSGQFCRVPVEAGSEADLALADGSRVRLERGMVFILHRGLAREVPGERTVELLSGALTAEVARDERSRFIVDAPGGKVTATGTRFWVRAGPPEGKEQVVGKKDIVSGVLATALAVAVFEGSVRVDVDRALGGEAVAIAAGEETRPQAAPGAPEVTARSVAGAVPADALLFVSTAGLGRWTAAVNDSALGTTWREERVRTYLKPLADRLALLLKDRQARVEQELANTVRFDQIEQALQGELGVAILRMKPRGQAGNPRELARAGEAAGLEPPAEDPVLLFVAEVGEHAEAFENGIGEFIRRVQLLLDQNGGRATLTARTYRGADLRLFTVSENHRIAYARTKGYFLLAFNEAEVEQGIDCLEGKARSLAETARIARSPDGLLGVTVNAGSWIGHERGRHPDRKDWKDLDALGLSALARVEYRLEPAKPAFREELRADFTAAKGMMELLRHARPVDAAKLSADVPASAMAFVAANLPADVLIATVMKTVEASNDPNAARNFRKGLDDLKAMGLDVEELLTRSLTGEVAAYATLTPGALPPVPDVVVIARLKSDRNVLANLRVLAGIAVHQQAVQRATSVTPDGQRFIDANKVRDLTSKLTPQVADLPNGKLLFIPAEQPRRGQIVPAAVVTADRLILASSDLAAKAAARGLAAEDSLAAKPAFKSALAGLPKDATILQYTDTPRLFDVAYPLAAMALVNLPFARDLGLEPAGLPPAADISRHLAPEVAALYVSAESLTLRTVGSIPRGPVLAGLLIAKSRGEARQGPPPAGRDPGPRTDPEPGVEEF